MSTYPAGSTGSRERSAAEKVYVVGAYVSNDDPVLRVRAFVPLPAEYRTLGEAVAAAERDYRQNDAPGADVSFVVYRAESGDAVVEHYVHTAKWEQFEYDRRITDWELARGFERY